MLIAIVIAVLAAQTAFAMINPASAYCLAMGYQYKIETEELGQVGYCLLPNGTWVGAWGFFRGEVAEEFSYCEQNGFSLKMVAHSDCTKFLLQYCAAC